MGGGPLAPENRGWQPIAPSPIPFAPGHPVPREATAEDLETLHTQFVDAARRAHAAGFQVLEIHMAHGYLLHEFLSPLTNFRRDEYGGSLENRMRFPLSIARAAREPGLGICRSSYEYPPLTGLKEGGTCRMPWNSAVVSRRQASISLTAPEAGRYPMSPSPPAPASRPRLPPRYGRK